MENSYVSRLIENQTICTMNGKRYIITDRMGAWNKQSVVLTWEGWQITSNSNFVSITPDEAFISVPLTDGKHDIELIYTTPGLKTGTMISLGCLILFLLSAFWRGKQEKNIVVSESLC